MGTSSKLLNYLLLVVFFSVLVTVVVVKNVKSLTVETYFHRRSHTPSILNNFPLPSFQEQFSESQYVLSKRILIRSAYFDRRHVNGRNNSVVFFLEMERALKHDDFIGCRIGNVVSNNVHLHYPKQYQSWAIEKKHVTKNIGIVYCSVDSNNIIKEGDMVYLSVYMKDENITVEVRSKRNLAFPSHWNNRNLTRPTVVSCIAPVYVGKVPPSQMACSIIGYDIRKPLVLTMCT